MNPTQHDFRPFIQINLIQKIPQLLNSIACAAAFRDGYQSRKCNQENSYSNQQKIFGTSFTGK